MFTGGGSGGHILPNLALIEELQEKGGKLETDVLYVGMKGAMEESMTRDRGIPFTGIQAGKLRRYFDWRNFTDVFRLVVGFFQSLVIVARFDPDTVFAKGGFVSVPVVLAAWVLRKRIITHESDVEPGLANRLIAHFADTVCLTFPKEKYGPKEVLTGLPLRREIMQAVQKKETSKKTFFPASAKASAGRTGSDKKTLFVFGGSLGADEVNQMVWKDLDGLLQKWNVLHLTGKGHARPELTREGYVQAEYVDDIVRYYQEADAVLCRAGATTVMECVALGKYMFLVPLGKNASRGEQWANAEWVVREGVGEVLGAPAFETLASPSQYKKKESDKKLGSVVILKIILG